MQPAGLSTLCKCPTSSVQTAGAGSRLRPRTTDQRLGYRRRAEGPAAPRPERPSPSRRPTVWEAFQRRAWGSGRRDREPSASYAVARQGAQDWGSPPSGPAWPAWPAWPACQRRGRWPSTSEPNLISHVNFERRKYLISHDWRVRAKLMNSARREIV